MNNRAPQISSSGEESAVQAERDAMLKIRTATTADIPLLRSLADHIWRQCYPGIITVEQIDFMLTWMYSEEQIRKEMESGIRWEIAEVGGEAIGFMAYGS